jgi:hypothetical protein
MRIPVPHLIAAGALMLAGSAGFLTSQALAQTPSPRTETINLQDGAPGPVGPAGPPGPAGLTCPAGYTAGILIINHPGGQVKLWTCLGN